jgi:Aspartyl protease
MTPLLFRLGLLLALPLGLARCAAPGVPGQPPGCDVVRRADLPLEPGGRRLLVPAAVNGQAVRLEFRTDLGADLTLTPASVAQLRLPPAAPLVLGSHSLPQARVDALQLGDLPPRPAMAQVRGPEGVLPPGSSASGLLGMAATQGLDIEIDPAARRLRLYAVRGCGDRLVPFAESYGALPLARGPQGQFLVPVTLDGAALQASLGSGSDATVLSRTGAERAGAKLPPAQPGALRAGLVAFRRLELGDLLLQEPRLLVLDVPLVGDAVLGNDFLGRQRIWISPATSKVYVARQPAVP